MSIHSISTFTSNFNGGTRPNRFKITGTIPGIGSAQAFHETGIYCLASSFPESTVGIIPIPFRGRIYKFPGDRQYSEWTATILDDTGSNQLWSLWHDWSVRFNDHEENVAVNRTHIAEFCSDLTIEQLDHQSDATIKSVQLVNAWPVVVGPIVLDSAAANTLTQFQVTVAYSHYTNPIAFSSITP
jgi:hypothetical protein